ncbi:ABC transporter permease [Pseudonocardia ailaonensis]|uniref:ABC transporter permease n=1 Tax=Pseudonocardia ailaonensis TaxID=367279 RepID=A0ABN2NB60_9PSEU
MVVVSVVILLVVVLFAAAPSLVTSQDPFAPDILNKLAPPSAEHLFGTDDIGRDLFTRIVYGTRASVLAALVAIAIAFVVSAVIGGVAGFFRGIYDSVLMRLVDLFLAVPDMLLALILISALGVGTVNVAIAVGVSMVASLSLVMRSTVLRVMHSPFVEAAKASGVRWPRLLVRHVLPHAAGPVLSLLTLEFGIAILFIASLSFLGFGAPLPAPEWGNLIAEGRNYMATAWWMIAFPGIVIVATVLSANRLSHSFSERGQTA